MAHLVTEWSTSDPDLADMLRSVAGLPENSDARLLAEAALHTFQAQKCHELVGASRREKAIWARNRRGGS